MQKIEIKPNDQTYAGKEFWSSTYSDKVKLLFVGATDVFIRHLRPNIETIYFHENGLEIDYFNQHFELIEEPTSIDWSKVKWGRHKKTNKIIKLTDEFNLSEALAFHTENAYFSHNGLNFNDYLNEHYEPIKFTQTLKVGDYIRYVGEPGGAFVIEGFILDIGEEGFNLKFPCGPDGYYEYKYHSDDWELVNSSVGCIEPEAPISNVEKNEFGDWVQGVCSGKNLTKLRLAPAILKTQDSNYHLSNALYSSLEEAKSFTWAGVSYIHWPAIPNKDGFYELPGVNDE